MLPLLGILYGALWLLCRMGLDFRTAYWLAFAVFMGLALLLFMGPVANPHNANDNTSGVITLLEIWAAMKAYGAAMQTAFPSTENKTTDVTQKAFYPSDQINFPVGIGVVALKRKKGLGLYLDRIHTPKDTMFMEENIQFLAEGTLRFLDKL